VTAQEFETQGNYFSPDIHIIETPDDAAASEWTQYILDKYVDAVVAYHIAPMLGGFTFSIELQFAATADGRATARDCLKEYRSGFRKGGVVPRKKKLSKDVAATERKTRLFMHRMYRLPDGQFFWYFARWDRHGNLIGKVESIDQPHQGGIPLENRIIHRSDLEKAKLIPKGEEPWTL